jgi:hypothetical protein
MKYLLFYQPLRSKLLLLLFATLEVFHGLKIMSIKLTRTSWIGCKLCLAFRQVKLLFVGYCIKLNLFTYFSVIFCQLLDMQTDSVSNQREHLILLLANIHIRRNPKTDQQSKVFSSVIFKHWVNLILKFFFYMFCNICLFFLPVDIAFLFFLCNILFHFS